MFTKPLPRFVIAKRLASGTTAFYFNIPTLYRKLGCSIANEPLGTDYSIACGDNGESGRAAALNGLFDEWNTTPKRRRGRDGDVDPLRDGRLAVPRVFEIRGLQRACIRPHTAGL